MKPSHVFHLFSVFRVLVVRILLQHELARSREIDWRDKGGLRILFYENLPSSPSSSSHTSVRACSSTCISRANGEWFGSRHLNSINNVMSWDSLKTEAHLNAIMISDSETLVVPRTSFRGNSSEKALKNWSTSRTSAKSEGDSHSGSGTRGRSGNGWSRLKCHKFWKTKHPLSTL